MRINKITDELPVHPTKRYGYRNLSRVHSIVVHHAALATTGNGGIMPVGLPDMIVRMARYHINHHNWPGLAYHYVIAPNGTVYKCNPVSRRTYHARGANTTGIGICLLGNFQVHDPTPEQLCNLSQLIGEIRCNMPGIKHVIGHRQVKGASTACPGARFTDAMLAGLG